MNIQTEYKKSLASEPKISTEQKLELIRTVRMQQQYNRNRCRERERILYGKSVADSELFASESSMAISPAFRSEHNSIPFRKVSFWSGLRLRFLLAATLFVIYLFADRSRIELFQKNSDELLIMLQENFEISDKIQAWNFIDL